MEIISHLLDGFAVAGSPTNLMICLIGAFLETTAIFGVARELGAGAQPKPINLTVNYLRSGRPIDSYANVSIVKHGRRIVAFEARAWQDNPNKPIASAFGHFMLRQATEAGDEASG